MFASLAPSSLLTHRGSVEPWPTVERRARPRRDGRHKLEYWKVAEDGNRSIAYRTCKRLIDIVGAGVLVVLFSPVLLATYVILLVATRGKPIFAQTRVGQCGRLFTLYKFRTMVPDADKLRQQVRNEKDGPIFKNRRDPRITPLGAVLRRFSIDELPQLVNVLRGDMSLVGPRPPLESEVLAYENWQLRRLAVKPGLTCLWQISGRSEIGFVQWVRMDLWYVDRQSLLLDLVLLALTPFAVLAGKGAY